MFFQYIFNQKNNPSHVFRSVQGCIKLKKKKKLEMKVVNIPLIDLATDSIKYKNFLKQKESQFKNYNQDLFTLFSLMWVNKKAAQRE